MLTESQRAVLATLRRTTDREGPLTTTDLTPYLPSLDRPKVAAAIKSLAAAGLIRRAGVGDRNAPTFAVTDQGRAALTQEG